MKYQHIADRLAERNISIDIDKLCAITAYYDNAAIILLKQEHKGQQDGAYRSRTESNGDLVVLIIRNHYPVTVMYRRSNQPATAEAMRVNQVVNLAQ
jgi:hypothetical protein